jgi:alanine racemase
MHRPTWAEIDLDAVEHNVREFKSKAFPDERDLVAVVKVRPPGTPSNRTCDF